MAFEVTFHWIDGLKGKRFTRLHNTNALIADVLLDITTIAALYDAVMLGGLKKVTISQHSTAEASAPEAGANADENASIQVNGADGYVYDFDLPMPDLAVINTDRSVDVTNAGIIALFAAFGAGDVWRINLRNPTAIASVIGGTLDK